MKSRLERREAEWKSRSPFMYPTKVLGIRVSRVCIIEKKKGVPNSLDLGSTEREASTKSRWCNKFRGAKRGVASNCCLKRERETLPVSASAAWRGYCVGYVLSALSIVDEAN